MINSMQQLKLLAVLSLLAALTACTGEKSVDIDENDLINIEINIPVDSYALFREEAVLIAASLSDSQLVSQCLLAGLDNRAYLSDSMKTLFSRFPPGGIMLFAYNLNGTKDEVRTFLGEAAAFIANKCGITPFVAVDHEGGLVHRFGPGVMKLPPPAFYWELSLEQGEDMALQMLDEQAIFSAWEICDLGITMVLAPVAETLNTENQVFLQTRTYGPDSDFVEKAAAAFIRAMNDEGIACVVKHFPGSSSQDTHFESAFINADSKTLESMIEPFRGIIAKLDPAAVMVSHNVIFAVDPVNNASLSPEVISVWLKGELGFNGIVLADDLTMKAVSSRDISPEEAAVMALNAGIDMVMCWPHNMASVHGAILDALNDGRLPRARLLDAAERVISEKLRSGLLSTGLQSAGINQ